MMGKLALWIILFILSFGVIIFNYVLMKRYSEKPWNFSFSNNYQPNISIIVPTYNEESIIEFKLKNLIRLYYPKKLSEILIVDSKSEDDTPNIVQKFITKHPKINMSIISDNKRKGKSAALNFALKHCSGEIIIISDADCFWPRNILNKSLPFLKNKNVGAITGSKMLLNEKDSWVTKYEGEYLKLMNIIKLGESKVDSTLFFEGGFSAYKKDYLDQFDPYLTGSDDCGTVISMCEKGLRSLLIPEAKFFSSFPETWQARSKIKLRRIIQLLRVFTKYVQLIINNQTKVAKWIILKNLYLYLLIPFFLGPFFIITIDILSKFPIYSILFFISLVGIPKIALNIFEIIQNFIFFFVGLLLLALNKKVLFWDKPENRFLINEDNLKKNNLI